MGASQLPAAPPLCHPGTRNAGGCSGRKRPRCSRADNAGALSRGLLHHGPPPPPPTNPPPTPLPYLPPLICLGRCPRLCSRPPLGPHNAHGVGPWAAAAAPLLGSVPPGSFLKLEIHLSQEEGKLLPLKPLAFSTKSSLLLRHSLLAPAGPCWCLHGGGGNQAAVPPFPGTPRPCRVGKGFWGFLGASPRLAATSLPTLTPSRKGFLLVAPLLCPPVSPCPLWGGWHSAAARPPPRSHAAGAG